MKTETETRVTKVRRLVYKTNSSHHLSGRQRRVYQRTGAVRDKE